MSGGSIPSNELEATLYVADDSDDTIEKASLCKECRQVDWDSLVEDLQRKFGVSTKVLRTIGAEHEPLATSSCKICGILSTLRPQSCDATTWFIQAIALEAFLNHDGVILTAKLYPYPPRGPLMPKMFSGKFLVAIDRDGCSSRTKAPRSIDYKKLKELTRRCEENHRTCELYISLHQFAGLRVIDVSSRMVIEAPKSCQYVALSYVWGKQQFESPDTDLEQFPPLIEDSISVTLSMGYRYLWVDKYVSPVNMNYIITH
jgi:hypothetical protein